MIKLFEERRIELGVVRRNQQTAFKTVIPPAESGSGFVPFLQTFFQSCPVNGIHIEFEFFADHRHHSGIKFDTRGHIFGYPVIEYTVITVGVFLFNDFNDFIHPFVIALTFRTFGQMGILFYTVFTLADIAVVVNCQRTVVQVGILFEKFNHAFGSSFGYTGSGVAGFPIHKFPIGAVVLFRKNAFAVNEREKFRIGFGINFGVNEITDIVNHFQHVGNRHTHPASPVDGLFQFLSPVERPVSAGVRTPGEVRHPGKTFCGDHQILAAGGNNSTQITGHEYTHTQKFFQKISGSI